MSDFFDDFGSGLHRVARRRVRRGEREHLGRRQARPRPSERDAGGGVTPQVRPGVGGGARKRRS